VRHDRRNPGDSGWPTERLLTCRAPSLSVHLVWCLVSLVRQSPFVTGSVPSPPTAPPRFAHPVRFPVPTSLPVPPRPKGRSLGGPRERDAARLTLLTASGSLVALSSGPFATRNPAPVAHLHHAFGRIGGACGGRSERSVGPSSRGIAAEPGRLTHALRRSLVPYGFSLTLRRRFARLPVGLRHTHSSPHPFGSSFVCRTPDGPSVTVILCLPSPSVLHTAFGLVAAPGVSRHSTRLPTAHPVPRPTRVVLPRTPRLPPTPGTGPVSPHYAPSVLATLIPPPLRVGAPCGA